MLNIFEFVEEKVKNKKVTSQKVGLYCSITQIILSLICLIYNAVNHENIWIWIVFLFSGVCLLSSNISRSSKR